MGLVNQATNILDRVVNLERGLEAVRKLAGLTSAIISRGGLSLLNDSFIKMVSSLGFQIFYVGPDSGGVQTYELRRDNGSLVMRLYKVAGQQFWGLYDRQGNILFSDDAVSGFGIASPWISVPMYPFFTMASATTYSYMNLPVASVASETVLWSGRIPQVSHGFIGADGVWGQASGSNSSTYRLKVNGTTVGTWNETGLAVGNRGPFDIHTFLNFLWVGVDLTVQASGSGNVAAQVVGCTSRGS